MTINHTKHELSITIQHYPHTFPEYNYIKHFLDQLKDVTHGSFEKNESIEVGQLRFFISFIGYYLPLFTVK